MRKSKKDLQKSDQVDTYIRLFNIFEDNIALHEVSIDTLGKYAENYDKRVIETMIAKIEASKLKKRKRISTGELYEELAQFMDFVEKRPRQAKLFAKNTLVSIISTFEHLLADLLRVYFTTFTDRLSLDNKSMSYEELKDLGSIEDAKRHLIEREVQLLLISEGLKEKIKRITSELGQNAIPQDYFARLSKIIKIRNLIVHNEGKADKDYVKRFGDGKIQEGDILPVSKDELTQALSLVYFLGSILIQDTQINFSKGEQEGYGYVLNSAIHRMVKKRDFDHIRHAFDYAKSSKMGDVNKKRIVINYCIALKQQERSLNNIEKVLNTEDWSTARGDKKFKMVLHAIRDEHALFYQELETLTKHDQIDLLSLDTWAIFDFYKRQKRFKALVLALRKSKLKFQPPKVKGASKNQKSAKLQ